MTVLALLLDALSDVPVSDTERAGLTWPAGFEVDTVRHVAAVMARARVSGGRGHAA
ncbi:MAG: hypothetical protein ACRDRI_05980 [Pseudonocardiaceae bacterium]